MSCISRLQPLGHVFHAHELRPPPSLYIPATFHRSTKTPPRGLTPWAVTHRAVSRAYTPSTILSRSNRTRSYYAQRTRRGGGPHRITTEGFMAAGEITGATPEEVDELREQHEGARLHQRHGIPFEVAFCLRKIGKQPDDYEGEQRFCKQRASKRTPDEWAERYSDDYDKHDERSYCSFCRFHFRDTASNPENLVEPGMANLKHGMYAENFRLAEDFSEADALMFDYIMSWADIYGWPPREEDPARYDMLEQFAYDRVRSLRSEDYFETVAAENDGQSQIEYREEYDPQGVVVGEYPVPNTLSEDLRLLRKDIRDQMKEMGLTPKARGEMDALDKESSAHEAIGELAQEALSGDHDYEPGQFSDEDESDEAADDDADESTDDSAT